MIYVIAAGVALILAAAIRVALRYRDAEARAAVWDVVHDRRSMAVGMAVTVAMLTTATVDDGLAGLGGASVLAIAVGAFVAAVVRRVTKPRTTSA